MMQPLKDTAWYVLHILNIELPFGPAISLPGRYPGEMKAYPHEKLVHKCPQHHCS